MVRAAIFNNASTSTQTKIENAPSRRGRTREYDWDAFYAEIAVRADLDSLPETQAGLEKDMADWCSKSWDKTPSESTLRDKISPIYQRHRKRGR